MVKDIRYKLDSASGITLVALVITIIILLILAGVAINQLIGEDGILNRTNTTILKHEQAQVLESLKLDIYENNMDDKKTRPYNIDYLQQVGKVSSEDASTVLVDKINSSMNSGKGSFDTGDVYYLNSGYLYYMNEDREIEEIGLVFIEDDIFIYDDDDETIINGIDDDYIVIE